MRAHIRAKQGARSETQAPSIPPDKLGADGKEASAATHTVPMH